MQIEQGKTYVGKNGSKRRVDNAKTWDHRYAVQNDVTYVHYTVVGVTERSLMSVGETGKCTLKHFIKWCMREDV